MNILLIGGRQASGPGLPAGHSYVGQLTRRLQADGHRPSVDLFMPASLLVAADYVRYQVLTAYDLILLQPDFGTLSLRECRQQLSTLLGHLHSARNQVVLITPLPQRTGKLLRNKQRAACIAMAQNWEIPCFDTTDVLRASDEFFQADTKGDLSAVAHELLGSELHQIYVGRTDPEAIVPRLAPRHNLPAWRRYFSWS